MKNFKNKTGFTLIELLVVMFILVTVGVIVTGIFAGTLRGGNKGSNINDIRQNGNYVISQMSKMIAYTKAFEGVCDPETADCTDPNSFITFCPPLSTDYKYLKIKSFDGGETIFSCNGDSDTPPNTIASRSAAALPAAADSLIDISKMKTTVCGFRCVSSSESVSPTIDVVFTLSSLNGTLVENNSTIDFETSIKPRN